jgi:hypothetical protein
MDANQVVKKFPVFMKPEGLSPRSQESAIGLHREPSWVHILTPFLKDPPSYYFLSS